MSYPEEKRIVQNLSDGAIYKRRASISDMETGKMVTEVIDLSLIADNLQKSITYFFRPMRKDVHLQANKAKVESNFINNFDAYQMSKTN